jgi:hypothetical protein
VLEVCQQHSAVAAELQDCFSWHESKIRSVVVGCIFQQCMWQNAASSTVTRVS